MTLRQYKKYNESPFAVDIKTRNRNIVASKIGSVYSHVSGELISDNVAITVQKSMDRAEFLKFFKVGIAPLIQMKNNEMKVFLYLVRGLQTNTGKAFFDMNDCILLTGFKKAWIYKSLAELCGHKFIARTEVKCYYWVNPTIVFNGSRLSIQKID